MKLKRIARKVIGCALVSIFVGLLFYDSVIRWGLKVACICWILSFLFTGALVAGVYLLVFPKND